MKHYALINTYLFLSYIIVTGFTNQKGLYSLLTVLIFALNLIIQLILAGLYRPARVTVKFVIISLIRFACFIILPKFNNIAYKFILLAIVGLVDLYQARKYQCKEFPLKDGYTNKEKNTALKVYNFVLEFSFLITAIYSGLISSFFILSCPLFFCLKNKQHRIWRMIEILIVIIFKIIEILNFVNFNNTFQYVLIISLVVSIYIRYLLEKEKKIDL